MNMIRALRKQNNISQNELAEKLNLSQQTVSSYENGTREPDIDTLIKLSNIFEVSIDCILGRPMIKDSSFEVNEIKASYHTKMDLERWIEVIEKANELGLSPEQVKNYLEMLSGIINKTK